MFSFTCSAVKGVKLKFNYPCINWQSAVLNLPPGIPANHRRFNADCKNAFDSIPQTGPDALATRIADTVDEAHKWMGCDIWMALGENGKPLGPGFARFSPASPMLFTNSKAKKWISFNPQQTMGMVQLWLDNIFVGFGGEQTDVGGDDELIRQKLALQLQTTLH